MSERMIYLSYVHDDAIECIVKILTARLQSDGYIIWQSSEAPSDMSLETTIHEALNSCLLYIVFITSALANPSLEYELEQALQYKKPIIPVLVNEATLPSQLACHAYLHHSMDGNLSELIEELMERIDWMASAQFTRVRKALFGDGGWFQQEVKAQTTQSSLQPRDMSFGLDPVK